MKKDTYYFSHDYHARNDGKLVKLMMKEGVAGIGIFWCIVEMLFEEGGKLKMEECERIAFELRTDVERITRIIMSYDLFISDGDLFWSDSIMKRLNYRIDKSEKARNSANNRWKNKEKQDIDANALRTQYDSNALKERKGKESIYNNTDSIMNLDCDEGIKNLLLYIETKTDFVRKLKLQLTVEQAEEILKKFSKEEIKEVLSQMDNHGSLTKKYQSVYRTMLNWLKNQKKYNQSTIKSQNTFTGLTAN